MNKGRLIILSGPSGSGKGTVLAQVFARMQQLRLSVSATTRDPRPGEVHGQHYFFISHDDFRARIAAGDMLEYAEYCGNFYGTPLSAVEQMLDEGSDVILEIEVQGAFQVKAKRPDALMIFIAPPSMEELRRRLVGRGTETQEKVESRLQMAAGEMLHAPEYDYIVINDEVEKAADRLCAVLQAARCEAHRVESYIKEEFFHEEENCRI